MKVVVDPIPAAWDEKAYRPGPRVLVSPTMFVGMVEALNLQAAGEPGVVHITWGEPEQWSGEVLTPTVSVTHPVEEYP
jgi:hypothetical protein